jgi:hypothetical protein
MEHIFVGQYYELYSVSHKEKCENKSKYECAFDLLCTAVPRFGGPSSPENRWWRVP